MSESASLSLTVISILGGLFMGGALYGATMNCDQAAGFSGTFGRTPTCKVVQAELRESLSRPIIVHSPPPKPALKPRAPAKVPNPAIVDRVAGMPITQGLSRQAISQASSDLAFAFQRGGLPAMAALTEACYRDNVEFPKTASPVTQTRCLLLDYGTVRFQAIFLGIMRSVGDDPTYLDGGPFLAPEKVAMRRQENARVLFEGDQEGQKILLDALTPLLVKEAMNAPMDAALDKAQERRARETAATPGKVEA